MSSNPKSKTCQWACQWKGSDSCVQCILNSQSLADGRVSLGVLCGLSHFYYPNRLPPCLKEGDLDWNGSDKYPLLMSAG